MKSSFIAKILAFIVLTGAIIYTPLTGAESLQNVSAWGGARLNYHGSCKVASNNCPLAISIPWKILSEFDSFLNYRPGCVAISECPCLSSYQNSFSLPDGNPGEITSLDSDWIPVSHGGYYRNAEFTCSNGTWYESSEYSPRYGSCDAGYRVSNGPDGFAYCEVDPNAPVAGADCTTTINGQSVTIQHGKTYLPNGQASSTMYSCANKIISTTVRCPAQGVNPGITLLNCPSNGGVGTSLFNYQYTNYGNTSITPITVSECSVFHSARDVSFAYCDEYGCNDSTSDSYTIANSPVGTRYRDYDPGTYEGSSEWNASGGWSGGWDNYYSCNSSGNWVQN